jgi:hypothetical protein
VPIDRAGAAGRYHNRNVGAGPDDGDLSVWRTSGSVLAKATGNPATVPGERWPARLALVIGEVERDLRADEN